MVPNANAEIIKRPRQVASIRYSGQWRFKAFVICSQTKGSKFNVQGWEWRTLNVEPGTAPGGDFEH
jgi:hypothetical protein